MLFISYNGWDNIGTRERPCIMALFTKAADIKNRKGIYGVAGLKSLLENPPPAFEPSDRILVERALKEAPAHRR